MKKNIRTLNRKFDSKSFIVIAAVVLILVTIGVYSRKDKIFGSAAPKDAPRAAYVKTEIVQKNGTIREAIVQNTSIEAVDRVNLLPRVTGRLEKLHVKAGDRVRKGETIATLEHEQQDAIIGASEAQMASAHADTEKAKAELMNAKTNLERYKRLVAAGFSTQQQYDTVSTAYSSAKASFNAALAKERQAASDTNRVRSSRGDYIIVSPLSGTVLNDYSLAPGAMISPSTPLIDIADMTKMRASLKIPESKIFAIKEGMEVRLEFDALPGKKFSGTVTRIDNYVDPATRTSKVETELDNEKNGMALRPGMFGQATITEKEERSAIVLPESSMHTNEKGFFVLTVKDGQAKAKEVSTGIREGNTIQITGGLNAGEEVIVFGGKNLKDGDMVTVQK